MKKAFSTAQILSVTTERLFCEMGGLYEILNFMTQDNLQTVALVRAANECTPYIHEQLEWTKDIDTTAVTEKNYLEFIADVESRWGTEHILYPMHSEDHESISPEEEVKRYNPNIKVTIINPEPPISPTGDVNWKVED